MAKSRAYDYKPPTYEDTVERAERKGSAFDTLFKDQKLYRAKQGVNLVRILPPGWEGARHYGLTIKVHRNVGPDDRQYLCLRENEHSPYKPCPICQALYDLGSRATAEDKKELRPGTNVAFYIIDRDNEKEGVQVWMASPTTESEISEQSVNHRTKAVLDIVHPDHGYDLEFNRTGTTRNNTRYRGFKVMRESSPLAESDRRLNEWLDHVFNNPLPSVLNFYKPAYLEEVFYGKAKEEEEERESKSRRLRDDNEGEREERGDVTRRRSREPDDDDDRPSRSRRDEPDERSSRSRDDDDDDRPRRSRDPEPEADERPRRSRDAEDDDRPRRSRDRGDDDDRDSRTESTRSSRRDPDPEPDDRPRRSRDPEPELEAERPRRERSRLEEDLDDSVPSEGGRRARSNGRDAEDEERPSSRRREREAEPEAEERPSSRRGRERDEEPEERPSRRSSRDDPDDEPTDSRRSRMRSRLDRGAEA